MDIFTLAVFLIMIMISINQGVTWAAAALMVLLVLGLRSKGLLVIVIVGLAIGAMFGAKAPLLWFLLAVIIIGVFIIKQEGRGPESYSPSMLMGGY
ncbi:MAG: hypothetical protein J7K68_00255 [Candidatus Diapherotrites archaeon]|nr:hypothetical protein [Candidatus Diapherotrites archaeon]